VVFYYNAAGVPFTYDPERDLGLAWDTDPSREVWRVFRDDVRISVDRAEFERLRLNFGQN
jgi:hypothetical protein